MPDVVAYKLFRRRSDGSLGPLFINKRQRIPIGEWLQAEDRPTKGYAHRPGWHCGVAPSAPHLSERGPSRVWAECLVRGAQYPDCSGSGFRPLPEGGWYFFERPRHQGGKWLISGELMVLRVLNAREVAGILESLEGL